MSFEDGMKLELETATALADTSNFAEGIDASLRDGLHGGQIRSKRPHLSPIETGLPAQKQRL
jgi:hypothetical protein